VEEAPEVDDGGVSDPGRLWDFSDPAGSERRFREVAAGSDGDERATMLTQVARALGLQEKYDEGLRVLDSLSGGPEVAARIALERGRLLRSSGRPAESRALFADAERLAEKAGRDDLRVDALHMAALVAEPDEQLAVNLAALELARGSGDPRARDWDASLLNNIGMVHADAGDHAAALAHFEEALAARERIGEVASIRVATWMVAWSLRNLGRHEEALALQHALKAELDADGEVDPYVDEEIALLEG
jgi:tetratricopeptide (TPR) repeat protein